MAVSLCDWYLVIHTCQIHGGEPEHPETLQCVEEGRNPFQFAVWWPMINTRVETAILLFNQHNWGRVGTATLPDYLGLQLLVDMVPNHIIISWGGMQQ